MCVSPRLKRLLDSRFFSLPSPSPSERSQGQWRERSALPATAIAPCRAPVRSLDQRLPTLLCSPIPSFQGTRCLPVAEVYRRALKVSITQFCRIGKSRSHTHPLSSILSSLALFVISPTLTHYDWCAIYTKWGACYRSRCQAKGSSHGNGYGSSSIS